MALSDKLLRLFFSGSAIPPKLMTLVMVQLPQRKVLLGLKKRGIGQGFYNGFGGKCEAGETIRQGAVRELCEEAGIEATAMDWKGVLHFKMGDNPQPWEVHVFSTSTFTGTPTETDEMQPVVFDQDAMPYDKMWQDDPVWQPLLFEGKRFEGVFEFDNGTTLLYHSVRCLDSQEQPPVCLDTPVEVLMGRKYWTGYSLRG